MDVCIPNIGPRECHRRLISGVALLVLAACIAGCLVWFDAPRLWRVLVFLPAWAGALGVFQVSAKTCVALAARGLRNMDAGDTSITDPRELEQVRAQAKEVHMRAAVSAAIVTGIILLLPA